jgi:hypothetical protein
MTPFCPARRRFVTSVEGQLAAGDSVLSDGEQGGHPRRDARFVGYRAYSLAAFGSNSKPMNASLPTTSAL